MADLLPSLGAHCCFWTDVYRYTGSTYQLRPHLWGDATYRLKDLSGDGRLEFVSGDDRFAYAFSAFAFSYLPAQIWSYSGGSFQDVTRRFPRQIRADSAHTWRGYLRLRRARYETEGALAAWAADQYLLGHRALVWKRLGPLARAGKTIFSPERLKQAVCTHFLPQGSTGGRAGVVQTGCEIRLRQVAGRRGAGR